MSQNVSSAVMQQRSEAKCTTCKDRGYYLKNFADNHFTPCRCPAGVGGARPVA